MGKTRRGSRARSAGWCDEANKFAYRSVDTARVAIRDMHSRGGDGLPMQSYPCGDHWHIAHQVPAHYRRRRES